MPESRGIPVYIGKDGSPIADPSNTIDTPTWEPSNKAAMHLVRILEGFRDVKLVLQALCNHPSPNTCKRIVKQLSVPLQNITQAIDSMYKIALNDSGNQMGERTSMRLKCSQIEFQTGMEDRGTLKTVRDKLSAHLDMICIEKPQRFWSQVDLGNFLNLLSLCFAHTFRLIAIDVNIYAWSRDSGHRDVWSLMASDGTLVDYLIENGKPLTILNMTLAPSPKFALASELREAIQFFNRLCKHVKSVSSIAVYVTDHNDGTREDVTNSQGLISPYPSR